MFEVPELASMVFSHLEHHHLAQCALVSKDWHSAVMPVLWRTIPDLHSPQQRLKFCELVYEDYDYCHRTIHEPDEEDLPARCECKPVLAIEPTKAEISLDPLEPRTMTTTLMKYGHWIRNVPEMYWFAYILQPSQDNYNINNNSHLQKQRNARIGYDMLRHFLERLPNVQFQTLMISRAFFRQECFLDYLIERVLPMVRELILNDVMDIVDLRRVLSATANSLTCLYVKRFLPVEFWAGFWRGCTSVTSLTIDDVIPGLVEVLKQDSAEHLPNLHTLCLGHRSFMQRASEMLGFSDKDVAMLLRTSTVGTRRGWRVIQMSEGATLGPCSVNVLLQHCSTLEKLVCWPTFESTVWVDLLASCPRMQVLQCSGPFSWWPKEPVALITVQQLIDWDEDMDEYRPWACEGMLQTLDIKIAGLDLNEDEWALHSKLYGRLARLTQLRELKLKVIQEPPRKGLVMTLKSVLARLSGLKKLEVLELYGFADHHIEHKDVEWMVKNWPQLRSIGGLPMFRRA
ncbi:hypothetical protein BGZ74_007873 [Mortierella antarctica]|nr:hypothetical protein BGZ74_007873 [Mortierella antarctica]